ncbi:MULTISPECIES: acyl-CoA dehydrogenase family protein [Streptomycetaceae]|uniref:Acyl-CoA dehydrogenase n=1 Tax=Streptantibioticus cattleyicolor (strain ATCC 35852 / DSM 46488 / JCM 4925 / NBRC 14057 / NRRL 8057) TaxID=1003195 RepID=F8JZ49_STREN|nr:MULTISPECIES: acyl-CoA dehydrogenase family protein [Streptomycetaceae]AEW94715.1 acyl-CoA dehydrogenase [Streptantibioticus cattleyicolor NRRL 8057 = DSM 46488]MYS59346.1 acyl-CoA dehydrogenase [Streptomyces sp. SID5468]CCB75071.1 putative acyl-CoA dehydrogenase [Streptantibioticus cattleyicolor NRRL 8057 = DSM 46488]
MDTAFTEEQDQIRRTLRDVLLKHCGPDEVKVAVGTEAGYDRRLWERLAGDLGLPGLALPRDLGGTGCGPTELALACEETGRVLLPSPLFAGCVLAAPLIASLGSASQRRAYLPKIASGELTATLATPAPLATALALTGPNDVPWAGDGRAGGVQARPDGTGWRLYGQAGQVLDGHHAGLLLVAAHTGGFARSRTALFLVDATAPGLRRTRLMTLDETRPQARIELRDVPAEPLGDTATGFSVAHPHASTPPASQTLTALTRTGELAATVLAAEAVGAASAVLASTVDHVRVREQFGRPIGSFQAVKHRLADVYVRVEAARSAAYYAAWAVGTETGPGAAPDGTEGIAVAAPLALAEALDALRHAASEAVQFHGGLGFTWEHHAHLYVKRAAGDELLFGPAHRLRAWAASRAGLFSPRPPGAPAATSPAAPGPLAGSRA